MGLKVFNFICENGHTFEAMISGPDEFERQKKLGFFTCPVCDSNVISRQPSAPHVQGSCQKNEEPPTTVDAINSVYKAMQNILDKSEFVGERFAEEARAIHRGTSPERVITGTPTKEEVSELRDEGIDVMPIGIKKKPTN